MDQVAAEHEQGFAHNQVIRAFKVRPDAPHAYAVVTLTDERPAEAFRPLVRITLNEHLKLDGSREMLPTGDTMGDFIRRLIAVLGVGAQDVTHVSRKVAVFRLRPRLNSWPDILNALCPRSEEAERKLSACFYMS